MARTAAWQRKEGKSKSGGLNRKGVASYRAANPGSKLKDGGESGFNAKLGGYRNYDGGYNHIDYWGMYWTSTVYTNDHSYLMNLFSNRSDIVQSGLGIISAISVRYVKD